MKIYDYKPGTMSPHSGESTLYRARRKVFNCDNCGISFQRHPSQRRGATISCSPECAWELKKIRVPKTCVVCGREFHTTPAQYASFVTCSRKCMTARKSYDISRTAPRFTGERLTRYQVCSSNGLSRNQFRYRAEKGLPLDASSAVHECGIRDSESDRSWVSISECAREIGVSISAVHAAVKRGGRCRGIKLVRTTPAMSSRKGDEA